MDEKTATAELLRVQPREFVAARNSRVAELKQAGERELAARIAQLRRPSPAQWALNAVAHTHPDLVRTWAGLAERIRSEQQRAAEGETVVGLRDLLADWRARTAEIVAAAPSGAPAGELTATLSTIGASPETTTALVAGLLGGPDDLASDDPADTSSKRARGSDRAQPARSTARLQAAARIATARLDEAEQHAEEAAGDLADAEAVLTAAVAAVSAAQASLELAQRQRLDAQRRLAKAQRAHGSAVDRVAQARLAQRAAVERLDAAE